jgi:hypothetical protein
MKISVEIQCRIRGRKGGFEYGSRTEMLSDEKRLKDVEGLSGATGAAG